MVSFNKVIVAGNLTRDPELRFTGSGIPVANFGLAVNRVKSKTEEVDFFDVTAWRELGETITNYKKKGDPILVEGRLQFRQWEAQDGSKRSKVDVVADNVQFLGKANGNGSSAGGAGGGTAQGGEHGRQQDAEVNEEDFDDIPFRALNAKRLNVQGIL